MLSTASMQSAHLRRPLLLLLEFNHTHTHTHTHTRTQVMRQQLLEDPQYCDHIAAVVNLYSAAILFTTYNVAAILVFAIGAVQNNSIDITHAFS